MSRRKIKAGSTSQTVDLFVQDTSSSIGAGLGGLVFNTSGLAAQYRREGQSTYTNIPLVTATVGSYTNSGGAGTGGGFVSDGGAVTGTYELSIPDAVLASGTTWAVLVVYGAANMLAVILEFELDTINYQALGGRVPSSVQKNVALANFEFMMTDSVNHAPVTGKTISCTRSIDGGAFAAGALANATEVGVGIYRVDFAAADLNGACITLRVTAPGCDDTFCTLVTSG